MTRAPVTVGKKGISSSRTPSAPGRCLASDPPRADGGLIVESYLAGEEGENPEAKRGLVCFQEDAAAVRDFQTDGLQTKGERLAELLGAEGIAFPFRQSDDKVLKRAVRDQKKAEAETE